eukprot:COSAG01_NODE_2855_length_6961_cov_3.612260_4_plen_79_part_00
MVDTVETCDTIPREGPRVAVRSAAVRSSCLEGHRTSVVVFCKHHHAVTAFPHAVGTRSTDAGAARVEAEVRVPGLQLR